MDKTYPTRDMRETKRMLSVFFKRVRNAKPQDLATEICADERMTDPATPQPLQTMESMQQALFHITEAARSSGYSTDIYQEIVDTIPRTTNYDASTISLYEGPETGFRIVSHTNLPPDWVEEVHSNEMYIHSRQLDHMFAQAKQLIKFQNFDADPVSQTPISRSGHPGMLMFPLQIGTRNWGLLTLQAKEEVNWTETETSWASLLGKHCEMLIGAAWSVMDTRTAIARQSEQFKKDVRSDIINLLDRKVPFEKYYQLSEFSLTQKEKDVLALISLGATNREIADKLYISLSTVKKHVHSILEKLQLQNRTQAASFAKQLNLDTSRFFRDDR